MRKMPGFPAHSRVSWEARPNFGMRGLGREGSNLRMAKSNQLALRATVVQRGHRATGGATLRPHPEDRQGGFARAGPMTGFPACPL
jgi:hypothetical protein